MKNVGNRLDVYLTEHGMVPSRERARALIMEGLVYVNEEKADKAGFSVPDGAKVEVRGSGLQYVSRGGLKLEKAFQEFPLDLKGKICMDIGASTGGFNRLYAAKRRGEGLLCRCRVWAAGMEAAL